MAEPFLSEIRMMSFQFAPKGWAFCNGQTMPINQNQALFSLLGTMYGGDGRVNFMLPDLRGRVPVHEGAGFTLAQKGGEQAHTISQSEMPQHIHVLNASSDNADSTFPAGNVLAQTSQQYGPPTSLTTLEPSTNGSTGGSQAHLNMQPYLTINFCIALQGIFPSQN